MSQTVERAIKILQTVAERPQRVAELSLALDVHSSTALRLVQTLERQRLVHRQQDGTFRLGSAMFRFAQQALASLDLRAVASAPMKELHHQTDETIHLAVLEGNRAVYIDKLDSTQTVRMFSRVGADAPLHCSGVGKAILAFVDSTSLAGLLKGYDIFRRTDQTICSLTALREELERIRESGYAIDNQENEEGIHCVAAPILDAAGAVEGSISVAAPVSRVDSERLVSYAPLVMAAARRISEELGWIET